MAKTNAIEPADMRGESSNIGNEPNLADGDMIENLPPGFDEFFVTDDMIEGAKAERGETISRDTHSFYWARNPEDWRKEEKSDRLLALKRDVKGSPVKDADGNRFYNQDLVLVAYPRSEDARLQKREDLYRAASDEGKDVPEYLRVQGRTSEQVKALRDKLTEEAHSNGMTGPLSRTAGRSLSDVYRNSTPEAIKRDEIIARRMGAGREVGNVDERARRELAYDRERAAKGPSARISISLTGTDVKFAPDVNPNSALGQIQAARGTSATSRGR